MATANLKYLSIYKDHKPPLRKNLYHDDIQGTRPPVTIAPRVREDYDGIHLGNVLDNYGKDANFFKKNSNINDQLEHLLKYNNDDSNKSLHLSEPNLKGPRMKSTTSEMLQKPISFTNVYGAMPYNMPMRSDIGISNFKTDTKKDYLSKYRPNNADNFDPYCKDDNLYRQLPKRQDDKVLADHVTESYNYGSANTAGRNLNLQQKYLVSKMDDDVSRRSQSNAGELNKPRFVDNLREFYDIENNAANRKHLNQLDKSRDYHEMITNPTMQLKKKPVYLSKKNREKYRITQPVQYLSQDNIKCSPGPISLQKEDLIDVHDRLTKEIKTTTTKISNLRNYRRHGNTQPVQYKYQDSITYNSQDQINLPREDLIDVHERLTKEIKTAFSNKSNSRHQKKDEHSNPFVWPKSSNPYDNPHQPFSYNFAPPISETQTASYNDSNRLNLKKQHKNNYSTASLQAEKALDYLRSKNCPDKLISLTSKVTNKKKPLVRNLSVDKIKSLSNEKSGHMGFAYDAETNTQRSTLEENKNSQRYKGDIINDAVFTRNTDLKTHTHDITYRNNRGYEPKFQYGPGTKNFERVHIPYR